MPAADIPALQDFIYWQPDATGTGVEPIYVMQKEGRSEGEHEAPLKIARTMLLNGIDRNTVMKMTGLTEDDLT